MYLRHFALTRLPFETPAHTDELYESNSRREAEARLHHLIELKGIGLLTGEVGSGKTTVCRHVAAALHPGLYRVGYVSLTTGNVLDMYKSIAWELGLPTERSRATAYRAIRAEITRRVCEAKQLPVLVIDEAQHLRNDVLEDLQASCATSPWTPRTACACCSSGSPSCVAASPWPCTNRSPSASSCATTSTDSTATSSTTTSPTACVSPAASSPCSNPAPSRHCSRARADCLGSSTALPTTP